MARAGTTGTLRKPFPRASHFEYREVRIPRSTSNAAARQMLTEAAEYGRWELARTSLYVGGERRVWLRRRIIKVASTLDL